MDLGRRASGARVLGLGVSDVAEQEQDVALLKRDALNFIGIADSEVAIAKGSRDAAQGVDDVLVAGKQIALREQQRQEVGLSQDRTQLRRHVQAGL